MRQFVLFTVIIFLTLVSIKSMGQTYNITAYNVENGLAQSDILSLYQDEKGYIWIGTNGAGINIFDGFEFRQITKDDGLVDNVVYSISQDVKGNYLYGTSGGFSIYDGKDFQNYTIDQGLPHNRVYRILEYKKGKIWVCTELGVVTLEGGKIIPFNANETLSNSFVFNMFMDSKDNYWFATYGKGIFQYDGTNFQNFTTEDGLYHNFVRDFIEDSKGNIWIGTWNGITIFNSSTKKLEKIEQRADKTTTVGAFVNLGNDNILVAKYTRFLQIFHDYSDDTETIHFNGYKFWSALLDSEGNIWLGTLGRGLIKLPRMTFINFNEVDGLHNNDVYAICKKDSFDYYIGSSSKGIAKLSFSNKKTHVIEDIAYNKDHNNVFAGTKITALLKSKSGYFWLASFDGLSRFLEDDILNFSALGSAVKHISSHPAKNLVSNYINCLYEDSKGLIWVGTNNGVSTIRDTSFANFNQDHPLFKNRNIWNIMEDESHNFWFSADTGVFVLKNGKIAHLNASNGFTDTKVMCVLQDKPGYFWIGTKEGVFRYDSERFERIDNTKGLSSNNVYSLIFSDKNRLFVGTNKGLDIINIDKYNTNRTIDIRHLGALEGFIGQECNSNACFKDDDGKLWFGTVKGVTIYDPERDILNDVQPITNLTNIQLDFKYVNWHDYSDSVNHRTGLPMHLTLDYNQNHLTFQFVATSLTIPEKVKYKYILEGLNREWSPPRSQNEADFPSLPPGEYVFKVKACNNDNVWNETPTVFKFTITPPFWATWWFYTLIGLLVLILFYAFTKYREASLKKDKIRLERTVQERTVEVVKQKEIVEQKNKDITDSINYAKNIQRAILPSLKHIKDNYPESFILFKPRDIVSGDFYWYNESQGLNFFAAADCTGHGVPGAFMSMLGVAFLNEIVNKGGISEPAEIVNALRSEVIRSLGQRGNVGESKDGMDMVLISIDKEKNLLKFCGANNPLYLMRNKEMIVTKGDKMPVAYYILMDKFKQHEIQLQKDDIIYFFSDGYADQFGGPSGKKIKYKAFKEILIDIHMKTMDDQLRALDSFIEEWKAFTDKEGNNYEQVDDILVIGVKI